MTDRMWHARAMTEALGRRETNKLRTRQALREASQRLFAERGYDATTVRDIAGSAGVTERTFFRYFAGKEDLVVDQVLAWLPALQDRIRARPATEDPLSAVKQALVRVDRKIVGALAPAPLWLFRDGPPGGRLPRSGPGLILKIEAALGQVIRGRLEATGTMAAEDVEYLADAYARTSLALMRTVLIRDWQLRAREQRPRTSLVALADEAFSAVQAHLPPPRRPPGPTAATVAERSTVPRPARA
ncbi:MAG TPA: TetR family transcriptional regulator [Acidimicrobiales bacterium]|nr:TetR family transcriptional regulator [Acidimicrobiales bacterium]